MASLTVRNNIIYISWYDADFKKQRRKSTKLVNTKANYEAALKKANELQKRLDKKQDQLIRKGYSIKTIREAFDHFKIINGNKHPKTIKDYERFYKKFTEKFPEDQPTSLINKSSTEEWLLSLREMKLSKNSIHGYGKQCNHFLNFLFEYNYTFMFKINRQVKTRAEIKPIIHFSDKDLKTIFEGLKSKNENFQMLIRLLFYTGLRSSDLLSIRIEYRFRKYANYLLFSQKENF